MIELLRVVKDELNKKQYKIREQLVKAPKEDPDKSACPISQRAQCGETDETKINAIHGKSSSSLRKVKAWPIRVG